MQSLPGDRVLRNAGVQEQQLRTREQKHRAQCPALIQSLARRPRWPENRPPPHTQAKDRSGKLGAAVGWQHGPEGGSTGACFPLRGCRTKGGSVRGVDDPLGMPQNFICADREQSFLLPPSLRDWLPADHLAWCVIEAVAEMDLSAF